VNIPGNVRGVGGIILAGGHSRRFGDRDKLLIDLGYGRTMIEEVAGELSFLEDCVISTGEAGRARRYRELTGIRTALDRGRGILAGILAGCLDLSTELVFVVGADMPFIRREVIEFQIGSATDFDAVVPRYPNGYLEPIHSVLRRTPAIGKLEGLCGSGQRRVGLLFECLNTRYLPVELMAGKDPDLGCFTNINDRSALESARRKSRSILHQAQNSRSSSSKSARALTSSLERD